MSLIGATIGALMALVPAARRGVILTWVCQKCGWANDNNNGPCRKCGAPQAKSESDDKKLARSNARLIDHIQSLERELLTERHLTQTRIEEIENLNRDLSIQRHLVAHWRNEAMRLAERSRENRDAAEKAQAAQARHVRSNPPDGRQAFAYAQQNAMQFAQQNLQGAQQMQAQAQLAQYALAQYALAQQGFDGFCNCVPSRAQVWGAVADHSLVEQFNQSRHGQT